MGWGPDQLTQEVLQQAWVCSHRCDFQLCPYTFTSCNLIPLPCSFWAPWCLLLCTVWRVPRHPLWSVFLQWWLAAFLACTWAALCLGVWFYSGMCTNLIMPSDDKKWILTFHYILETRGWQTFFFFCKGPVVSILGIAAGLSASSFPLSLLVCIPFPPSSSSNYVQFLL